MQKETFEKKISPILQYIGAIGAGLTSVAYVIVIFVLIRGFQYHQTKQTIVFALVNAAIGLIICQFLKVQGISFAKNLPENQEILKEYYDTKTKDKKLRNINFYWITSVIKDVAFKGISLIITTAGLIYTVIQGSNDWNLLFLAIVNLIMFISIGLLSLN